MTQKAVVQVIATAAGLSVSRNLTLALGGLVGLSLAPSTVVAGQSSEGTVVLSFQAPAVGRTVKLTSDQAFATVPASVVVPGGATSAKFAVTTIAGGSGPAVITASLGTAKLQATLNVTP